MFTIRIKLKKNDPGQLPRAPDHGFFDSAFTFSREQIKVHFLSVIDLATIYIFTLRKILLLTEVHFAVK